MKRAFGVSALALLAFGASLPAAAQTSAASDEEIIVTGTREASRTQFETLAPVDVLNERTLDASTSNELVDALAQVVPSFQVQRLPMADGQVFVRPATLRNLSPDQTLVLINGRRLHRSAHIGSRGAQAADLAQIPSYAIKRIEVLRDGASAQYGSDAIAGVVNIILDDRIGYATMVQVSQYYEGDGLAYRVAGQGGFEIGDGGFITITGEWAQSEITSRTRQRPDAIAFQAANPTLDVPNPVQRWGQPELESTRFAFNAGLPLVAETELFAFGTYGQGQGLSDFNWRNPDSTGNVYNPSTVFPGWDFRTIYPTGFTPRLGQEHEDYQLVGGARGVMGKFTWDVSASYGSNETRHTLSETLNASLGPDSPTHFYLGQLAQREFNLNADFSYQLSLGLANPVNLAFGVERREETYEVSAGDPASYAVGPGAATGLAPNANGFPGYSPQQAGEFEQESYGAYVDVEADLTQRWSVGVAVRYEDFSEFGDTTDYKLATRYAFTDDFALRASYSTGFRAPTPAQLYSTSVTQGLDTTTMTIFNTGRLSPSDLLAVALGARPLKAEEAETVSAGLTWRTGFGLSGSIDAYQIDVTDRFSQSATQAIPVGAPNPNGFTGVSFFVNAFDTTTRGVDIVTSYTTELGIGQLSATLAYNYNETEVNGGTTSVVSSSQQRRIFEESRPKHNATASLTYDFGRWSLGGRLRYYGQWVDSSGNTTGVLFQEFGAMTLVDLSVDFDVTENVSLRVGAENVFDEYPDEATNQAVRGLIYSRNAPYDTDGGQYYARISARF